MKVTGAYLSGGFKFMNDHVQSMAFAIDAEGLQLTRHCFRCMGNDLKDLIILYRCAKHVACVSFVVCLCVLVCALVCACLCE